MDPRRVLIVGAAGRDFHNFNLVYRGRKDVRGRRLHRHADSEHRRPPLPGRPRRASLPGGHPDPSRVDARGADSRARRRRGRLLLLRRDARARAARRLPRARRRSHLQPALAAPHDAHLLETGRGGLRRAHRIRKEPDDASHRRCPPTGGQARRSAPAPDAVRRSHEAGRPALRRLRRSRRRRLHDRGARGVRAAPRRGQSRLRGNRLRRDPRPGRAGSGRDPLGRRQQRHAVREAEPPRRRRRSASSRTRASLPPGRDQLAHGGRRAS